MTSESVHPIDSNTQFVEEIISPTGVSPLVLEAFRKVDRMQFVPLEERKSTYMDNVIGLNDGDASLSQPTLVAQMIDLLNLSGEEKVLEIGTASGFNAALLSRCAAYVNTVEYNSELADQAKERLDNLGYDNINVHVGDGVLGWEEGAPYDAIIVTAMAESMPPALVSQLSEGGKIVIPIGHPHMGRLIVGFKKGGEMQLEDIMDVGFTPLISEELGGWTQEKLHPDIDFSKVRQEHKEFIREHLRMFSDMAGVEFETLEQANKYFEEHSRTSSSSE